MPPVDAPRTLESLRGKELGVIVYTRPNAVAMAEVLETALRDQYHVTTIHRLDYHDLPPIWETPEFEAWVRQTDGAVVFLAG